MTTQHAATGSLKKQVQGFSQSVAACSNVPYGQRSPRGKESTSILEEAFEGPHLVTPPNPDGPVLVDLGLFIVEITSINEVENTFKVEGFVDLIWCDPRLAFNPETTGLEREIFLEEDAELVIERIWWPDITLVNEVNSRDRENQELIIEPDGTVGYKEKFSAELEARYDFRSFPFDQQQLEIEIESFAWSDDFLLFQQEQAKIGFSRNFEIPEWHTEGVETKLESVQEIRDRAPFSEFIMNIEVSRQSGFYIWKVILPLLILVMISWSVFWMIGDGLADRMSVSLTGILTIVAYQFIISDSLPRVTYFTFMDTVLTLSFVLMALTIVENVFVNVLYLQNNKELAHNVDHVCRWAFPATYFLSLVILAGIYLL